MTSVLHLTGYAIARRASNRRIVAVKRAAINKANEAIAVGSNGLAGVAAVMLSMRVF